MDIEGFEYEALTGLRFKDSCSFPTQIAIELHWTVGGGKGGLARPALHPLPLGRGMRLGS